MSETLCVSETPRVSVPACVSGMVCAREMARMSEQPCVKGAPQVKEPACARETARVCEARCVSETPRVSAPAGVSGVVCVSEARVSERPSVRVTACVRSLCVREMTVAMREHAAASPGVSLNGIMCSLGVVPRRCAWVERRRRLRQWRDKGRVAAVVAMGTVRVYMAASGRSVPCNARDPTCSAARVRPGAGTHAVDVADPADGQRPGWVVEFGLDGFSTWTRV